MSEWCVDRRPATVWTDFRTQGCEKNNFLKHWRYTMSWPWKLAVMNWFCINTISEWMHAFLAYDRKDEIDLIFPWLEPTKIFFNCWVIAIQLRNSIHLTKYCIQPCKICMISVNVWEIWHNKNIWFQHILIL